jgi:hypothetical protein
MDDSELLREYVARQSENAFAELVARRFDHLKPYERTRAK